MLITKINHHSDVPVYKQIITEISDAINSGILKEGEELPSIRKLALETKVNPNTIAKAYLILQTKGYIYSISGVGYRVAHPPMEAMEERLEELEGEMRNILKKMKKFPIGDEDLKKRIFLLVKEVIENDSES
jgi:GntR family transcriptional regulator